jgi:hypothetical protein
MPDYAAYEELSLVARFGSENERRDESLDDVRMDWQDRTDGDDDDNESHHRADDIDPQELQDLRRDKEWREGLAEYKRARAAIPQAA